MPTITSIGVDNSIYAGEVNVLIVADFASGSVVRSATLGGQALTITDWNGGSPIITVPFGINKKWDTLHTLTVTDDAGAVNFGTPVTLEAPPTYDWIEYTYAPIPNDVGYVAQALNDLGITMAITDFFAIEQASGMTVLGDGSVEIAPAADKTGSYKIWDQSENTFTSLSTYNWTNGPEPHTGGIYTSFGLTMQLSLNL